MSRRAQRRSRNKNAKIPLPWIALLLFVLLGLVLLAAVGRYFVFYYDELYTKWASIGFFVLLPVIGVARIATKPDSQPDPNPPQSALFAMINWVILTAIIAAAIAWSPLSYIAALSAALGKNVTVNAQVCCGRDKKPRYQSSCRRYATIVLAGDKTEVCLADLYEGSDDLSGKDVLLDIRQSSFGYSIGEVRLAR